MKRKVLAGLAPIVLAVPMSLAVASPASATSQDHKDRYKHSSVSCELSGEEVRRHRIKLTLDVTSKGKQGNRFEVEVTRLPSGREIFDGTIYDSDGDFSRSGYVRDRHGVDRFKAKVTNKRTGDSDTCYARVPMRDHHNDDD